MWRPCFTKEKATRPNGPVAFSHESRNDASRRRPRVTSHRAAYFPPMLFSGFQSPFSTLYIVMPPFFRSPFASYAT